MEWFLFLIACGCVLFLLLNRIGHLPKRALWVSLILLGISGVGARYWNQGQTGLREALQAHRDHIPSEGRDGGYVSSETCQACHPNEYASWHQSYHRTMTQFASPESVRGDFSSPPIEFMGSPIRFDRIGDEYWIEMDDPVWLGQQAGRGRLPAPASRPRVRRRIGMLTGSHHMQAYWVPDRAGNQQHLFPLAYMFEGERWVPFDKTFLRDPTMPHYDQTWNLSCISCHATGGQTRVNYQTRSMNTRAGELGIACEACHGPAEQHLNANRNPMRRYKFHQVEEANVDERDPTIVNPASIDSKRASMVCGQCHGIHWIADSRKHRQVGVQFRPGQDGMIYSPDRGMVHNRVLVDPAKPETQPDGLKLAFEANPRFVRDRYWSDGMVRVSGREFNGTASSPCYERGELSCLSCHQMHHPQPELPTIKDWADDQLAVGMRSNEACLQCHDEFRDDLEDHTRHPIDSSGSQCYNCHMPHTTYGLLKGIRSHQIDSPTVQSTLDTGRPNACNLCHLDKTLAWSAGYLTQWFQQPKPQLSSEQGEISAAVLWLLKGDAGQRALLAWHAGWEPAKATSGEDWLGVYLAQLLVDPYSAVRFIAQRSLKKLKGFTDLEYDFIGLESERSAAKVRAESIWNLTQNRADFAGRQSILFETDGSFARGTLGALLRERDDRSIDLQE